MPGYGADVMLYIDSARDFVLPRTIVYTESMCRVGKQITDGHTDICLTGPKGCGKSITIAVLFLMLNNSESCCVYLTQKSFKRATFIVLQAV